MLIKQSIYADQRSTMAHMRGLRDMIQTRGGIHNITFELLRKMLLRYVLRLSLATIADQTESTTRLQVPTNAKYS